MNGPGLDLKSQRAREARLGQRIGKSGYRGFTVLWVLLYLAAIIAAATGKPNIAAWLVSCGTACLLPALWYKRHLAILPVTGGGITGRLSPELLARLSLQNANMTPCSMWAGIKDHWQALFICHHLLLATDTIESSLSDNPEEVAAVLGLAEHMAGEENSEVVDVCHIAGALIASSAPLQQLLTQAKAAPNETQAVTHWIGRNLEEHRSRKQKFGGIGRDWAFGFTPLLDRFGMNVSLSITNHGAHFGWLTESAGVKAMETALANRSTALALVGPDGIGKSSSVYALAQRMIEGRSASVLAYHQIISLNATDIISSARTPGDLERLMLNLSHEASAAGHVILFFDDAQLFFSDRPGAFDAGQILLSIIQSRITPVILAMTAADFQRLKTTNTSLANLMTPVVLQELDEAGVMRVLEDSAVGLENRHKVLIAYEALIEAYKLSGRYEQEEAYPGKAIKLLEQSVNHANNNLVNATSVQKAIETTRGIRVGTARAAEADTLLHLEDLIHLRMINQTHAVKAVASALRRSRAGVTNPRRPIGSFLFLGPTGVGKTELAKAIAHTYFGSESNLIRLDMSEYQQPDDVQRLLSPGQTEAASFLLSVRQQPFTVVLLDEIEKAHPNVLNLLLQLLDEGQLTDSSGRVASFKDCIIIATSNAGAATIRERVGKGENISDFSEQLTDELIGSGQFRPELLNRFDDMIIFRPLNEDELAQVVKLMLADVNKTLADQNLSVELTDAAIGRIVAEGNDPRLGARPMRRTLQRAVEDTLAQKILSGAAGPGQHITLDAQDLNL